MPTFKVGDEVNFIADEQNVRGIYLLQSDTNASTTVAASEIPLSKS